MEDYPYDICWDVKAGQDLTAIYDYLLENASQQTAQRVKKEIVSAVGKLRTQPEICPPDPYMKSRPENFRYLRIWQYKVVYEFTGQEIIITRIFHFHQDLKKAYSKF